MPDLPPVPIRNTALYARAAALFPGDTQAQKTRAYRNWVRRHLRDDVIAAEKKAIVQANRDAVAALEAQLSDLAYDPEDNPVPPPPPAEPPLEP